MCVREEVAADLCVRVDNRVRKQRSVGTEDDVIADDSIRADVRAGPDLRGRRHNSGGMNAGWVCRRLVEELERAGEGEVGVVDAQGCCGDLLEAGLDHNGRGARGAGERCVLGIGDEGELAGLGVFEARCGGDLGVGIAQEGCAEMDSKVGKLHGEIVEETASATNQPA